MSFKAAGGTRLNPKRIYRRDFTFTQKEGKICVDGFGLSNSPHSVANCRQLKVTWLGYLLRIPGKLKRKFGTLQAARRSFLVGKSNSGPSFLRTGIILSMAPSGYLGMLLSLTCHHHSTISFQYSFSLRFGRRDAGNPFKPP